MILPQITDTLNSAMSASLLLSRLATLFFFLMPFSVASPGTLERPLIGYNLGAWCLEHPSWNESFYNTSNLLRPSFIRIPSGTLGNYWNWSSGAAISPYTTPAGGSTLLDFKALLDATEATPIFMLNMLTDSLENQIKMLHSAARVGLFNTTETVLLELGNEFYFGSYSSFFKDGGVYGALCAQWMDSITLEFPRAAFAVVTSPSFGSSGQRILSWDDQVFTSLKGRRFAVSMHEYHDSGLGCAGCPLTRARATAMLTAPAGIASKLATTVSKLPAAVTDVWVTEWSLNMNKDAVSKEAAVFGSWASGIFTAATALLYACIPRVTMIGKHALLGDVSAGAIFGGSDGFNVVNSVDPSLPSLPWTPTASGWALGILANASFSARSLAPLSLSPQSTLLGAAFDDSRAVIINMDASPAQVPRASLPKAVTLFSGVSADALLPINGIGSNSLLPHNGTVSDAMLLPAYSVTQFF